MLVIDIERLAALTKTVRESIDPSATPESIETELCGHWGMDQSRLDSATLWELVLYLASTYAE